MSVLRYVSKNVLWYFNIPYKCHRFGMTGEKIALDFLTCNVDIVCPAQPDQILIDIKNVHINVCLSEVYLKTLGHVDRYYLRLSP